MDEHILNHNNFEDCINFIFNRDSDDALKIEEEKSEVDSVNENLSNMFLRVCYSISEREWKHQLKFLLLNFKALQSYMQTFVKVALIRRQHKQNKEQALL